MIKKIFIIGVIIVSVYVGLLFLEIRKPENDGYDLSHHNKNIKWDKLEDAQFVYLKATEGVSFIDPKFKEYRTNARKHNIKVGAYHFMRPNLSGKMQFEHFRTVVGDDIDMIPVLDIEVRGIKDDDVKQFIIENKKYYRTKPMIYCSIDYYLWYSNTIKDCKWWMSFKPDNFIVNFHPNNYSMWQYNHTKRVSGMQIDHNSINPKLSLEDFLLNKK